jgi:hypothetical protein
LVSPVTVATCSTRSAFVIAVPLFSSGHPQVLQFFEAQLPQALDVFVGVEVLPLPETTEKHEKSLVTLLDEQRGHFRRLAVSPDATTSNVFRHLAHSYSNMGKVITPIALSIIS